MFPGTFRVSTGLNSVLPSQKVWAHPEPVTVALFGNRIFVDVIVKMRSY